MNQVITVSQLNFYIKSLLDGNDALKQVFLTGEISNFTDHYRSGHFYFSLKDEKSVIKCAMFSRYSSRVRFHPEDGMKVLVRGGVSVYEASGQYQLYVEDMPLVVIIDSEGNNLYDEGKAAYLASKKN